MRSAEPARPARGRPRGGHDNNVIAKAVRYGFLHFQNVATLLLTRTLDSSDLESIAPVDSTIPVILQPRLHKRCDLRITVVGKTVFPVAIWSQQHAETSVDWRAWDLAKVDLTHSKFGLPPRVSDRCLALNKALNLRFSCIDMVLTTDGEFYFLEVNPNGQWAWIEDMVGPPIRDAIIDLLAGTFHDYR